MKKKTKKFNYDKVHIGHCGGCFKDILVKYIREADDFLCVDCSKEGEKEGFKIFEI